MRATLPAADFANAVAALRPFVARTDAIPVLATYRVEAGGGHLSIQSNNLEQCASARVACEGVISPSCWPAWFVDAASRMRGDLTVTQDGSEIVLTGGGARYAAQTLPADQFPVFAPGLPEPIPVDRAELASILSYAATFTDRSALQVAPWMAGVFLERDGGELAAVGFNKKIFGRATMPWAGAFPPVILPFDAIEWLAKRGEQSVSVSASDVAIRFRCGDAELVSKVIEGPYPTYWKGNIPAPSACAARFDIGEALSSLKRLSSATAANPKLARSAVIHAWSGDDSLTFHAPQIGSETIRAEVRDPVRECGSIGSQLVAVLSALSALGVETAEFASASPLDMQIISSRPNLTTALAPLRIVPVNAEPEQIAAE